MKRSLEYTFDVQNATELATRRRATDLAARALTRATRMAGDRARRRGVVVGQRHDLAHLSRPESHPALRTAPTARSPTTPQRRVLNVVDAVVAGHGDGPLSPLPLPLGLLFAGASSAAVDWVGAHLLGYDPTRIPIAREAFGTLPRGRSLALAAADVTLLGALGEGSSDELLGANRPEGATYPVGWLDAVSGPARGAPDVAPAEGSAAAIELHGLLRAFPRQRAGSLQEMTYLVVASEPTDARRRTIEMRR